MMEDMKKFTEVGWPDPIRVGQIAKKGASEEVQKRLAVIGLSSAMMTAQLVAHGGDVAMLDLLTPDANMAEAYKRLGDAMLQVLEEQKTQTPKGTVTH